MKETQNGKYHFSFNQSVICQPFPSILLFKKLVKVFWLITIINARVRLRRN